MKLKVVLEPSDEGGYTVHVPSLPGCISEGETVEKAQDLRIDKKYQICAFLKTISVVGV